MYIPRLLTAAKLLRGCISTGDLAAVEELRDMVKDLVLS